MGIFNWLFRKGKEPLYIAEELGVSEKKSAVPTGINRESRGAKEGQSQEKVKIPKFVTKRQTPSGTYEVYKGSDAESAKDFLKNKKVNENKYYIKVETPEGNWGVDINGLYLERLVLFQLDINSSECEGSICGMPTPTSLQYAVNGLVDNFVVTVRCGKCSHKWEDGIRYKNMTVVRCPNCNSLNKVDSGPHITETEMPGLVGFRIEI